MVQCECPSCEICRTTPLSLRLGGVYGASLLEGLPRIMEPVNYDIIVIIMNVQLTLRILGENCRKSLIFAVTD